jgi:hypothetical protein
MRYYWATGNPWHVVAAICLCKAFGVRWTYLEIDPLERFASNAHLYELRKVRL